MNNAIEDIVNYKHSLNRSTMNQLIISQSISQTVSQSPSQPDSTVVLSGCRIGFLKPRFLCFYKTYKPQTPNLGF